MINLNNLGKKSLKLLGSQSHNIHYNLVILDIWIPSYKKLESIHIRYLVGGWLRELLKLIKADVASLSQLDMSLAQLFPIFFVILKWQEESLNDAEKL